MSIVHFRGKSYKITDEQLVEIFSSAIDKVLGKDSSDLVYKTAKLIYGEEYRGSIPQKLDSFQQFLKKTLGERAYIQIIDFAISQMQKYSTTGKTQE